MYGHFSKPANARVPFQLYQKAGRAAHCYVFLSEIQPRYSPVLYILHKENGSFSVFSSLFLPMEAVIMPV